LEIVLVRHAQPDWEPGGRAQDDPGLTPHGERQARRVASALAGERFDHFCVSSLRRAAQTAAPIEERLGHPPELHAWLDEQRLPRLAGRTTEEVRRFFDEANARPLEDWWEALPGGESFRAFYERVAEGVEELLGAHEIRRRSQEGQPLWDVPRPRERTLIVAHQGSIAVVVSHLLGLPPEPFAAVRFACAWTGVTRLHSFPVQGGSLWAMERWNATDHLADLPRERGDGRPVGSSLL